MLVARALQHVFPYTNEKDTLSVLRCILDLQSKHLRSVDDDCASQPQKQKQEYPDYTVDIATLEVIGAAASRAGNFEICLQIWDLVNLFGYEPTDAIFENTAVAFAANSDTYLNCFTILAEMEQQGREPSRALIRNISVYMRYDCLILCLRRNLFTMTHLVMSAHSVSFRAFLVRRYIN